MIKKNSSNHGSVISKKTILIEFDKFFQHACRCDTILDSIHFKIIEVQRLCTTDSPPQSLSDLSQTTCVCAPIVWHMHNKFEINQTKIKGSCQSYTKVAPQQQSWSDSPLKFIKTTIVDG